MDNPNIVVHLPIQGEIGRFESFRFITELPEQ